MTWVKDSLLRRIRYGGKAVESDIMDESAEARHKVAMRLLDAGVPLTLLFDLLSPDGPDSLSILEAERADATAVAIS